MSAAGEEQARARRAALALFADKRAAGWPLTAVDAYRNAQGEALFHRVRFDPPPGSAEGKFIRPIHFDGKWKPGEPPAPPPGKPLFLLPELLRADPARPVYVVEGEKAARALQRLGLVVTTSGGSSSAAAADWTPLRGRHVRIWPDHDEAGARYGAEVAALLAVLAPKLELLDPAHLGLPPKGDAHDWAQARPGARAQDVDALAWWPARAPAADEEEPPAELVTIRAAKVEPEQVQWLWPGRIAIGKLTLIAGDPGLGKSMLTAGLAAHVTRGRPWPVDGTACPQGEVLLISGEDGAADTIRPRLDAAGADAEQVHILQAVRQRGGGARMLCLQRDLKALDLFLQRHPLVRLVSIDPLTAYLGDTDSHKNSDVRALLQPLGDLAAQRRVAIVAVSHLNKGGEGGSALYRVSGSLAFVAAARASFLVIKDRNDPQRRLVLPSKNNLAQDSGGLAYRIGLGANGAPRVEWEAQAVSLSADEALLPCDDHRPAKVRDWLRGLLAAGPMPAKQVQAEAEQAGIVWRKVQRAAEAIGVSSVREGFGGEGRNVWSLGPPRQAHECHAQPGSPAGESGKDGAHAG